MEAVFHNPEDDVEGRGEAKSVLLDAESSGGNTVRVPGRDSHQDGEYVPDAAYHKPRPGDADRPW